MMIEAGHPAHMSNAFRRVITPRAAGFQAAAPDWERERNRKDTELR